MAGRVVVLALLVFTSHFDSVHCAVELAIVRGAKPCDCEQTRAKLEGFAALVESLPVLKQTALLASKDAELWKKLTSVPLSHPAFETLHAIPDAAIKELGKPSAEFVKQLQSTQIEGAVALIEVPDMTCGYLMGLTLISVIVLHALASKFLERQMFDEHGKPIYFSTHASRRLVDILPLLFTSLQMLAVPALTQAGKVTAATRE